MPIETDFSVTALGDVRHTSGTTVYSVLALHAWLQDLADNSAASGDDLLDILAPNPSKLDGPRDAAVASRLNLLTSGSVIFNLDDTAAQFVNFGSVKQSSAATQYSGLKTIGGIVAASPIYVVQNNAKITSFWANGHLQILVKVKTGGSLIAAGIVTAYSRKWQQTFSHFDVDLSAGGESNAALSTAVDANVPLTTGAAAALSAKVTITFGDTTQDIGNGNGAKLYKGTIALTGGCTLQEMYQYLQYSTYESTPVVLNTIPGWRYRLLNAAYTEIPSAPFGTFAGGSFFAAQGWYITGVAAGEATKYQLTAHDGTTQTPPNLIGITVGNLVSGDRVLVTRDNAGAILKDEYTPVAALAGATSIQIVESIKTDTPAAGVIRIKNLRYTYTSFTAGTKTFNGLSPALASNIATIDDVFVPFVDIATVATSESATFVYASTFTARVDVRQGAGGSPIVPFSTTLSIGTGGGSVNTSRNLDV